MERTCARHSAPGVIPLTLRRLLGGVVGYLIAGLSLVRSHMLNPDLSRWSSSPQPFIRKVQVAR